MPKRKNFSRVWRAKARIINPDYVIKVEQNDATANIPHVTFTAILYATNESLGALRIASGTTPKWAVERLRVMIRPQYGNVAVQVV